MNREIKFRAWDGDKMHYPETNYAYELSWTRVGGWQLWWKWDGVNKMIWGDYNYQPPLMECTGIKDKNGKQIYDMDLVKDGSGNIYRVYMHERYQWSLQHADNLQYSGTLMDSQYILPEERKLEVIGNIYENH